MCHYVDVIAEQVLQVQEGVWWSWQKAARYVAVICVDIFGASERRRADCQPDEHYFCSGRQSHQWRHDREPPAGYNHDEIG